MIFLNFSCLGPLTNKPRQKDFYYLRKPYCIIKSSNNCSVKLQLHDAIYRLRFYSKSLIHILSLSNSHNNVASIKRIRGDKSHRVIVALVSAVPDPAYVVPLHLKYQVIPGHGNPQKRRIIFISYLFKYCSLNYKKFHQIFESKSR